MRGDEALQRKLDRMVTAEVLTQEEADQIASWYQSRPDTLPLGIYHRGGRGPGHGFRPDGIGGTDRGDNGVNDTRAFRGAPQAFTPAVTTPTILY